MSSIRVLVVDDALIARSALKILLEEQGCNVVTANNGREAIDEFDGSFDLIFMDYLMPEMNGDKSAEMIRQKEKGIGNKKSVYIVGLSAHNSEEINQRCLDAGINQILEKPIHPEVLKKILSIFGPTELTPIQR